MPQGSILGPLLFLVYINDLPGCLLHAKVHMFADDTTIHTSSLSTAELYAKINTDLTRVRDWLLANKLILNVTKTEFMFLTTDFKLFNLGKDFSIKIENNRVKRVKTTKYLGIHLDKNLKWDEHVNKLCSKVTRSISGLKQARDYVPLDVLIILQPRTQGGALGALGARAPPPHLKKSSAQKRPKEERKFRPDMSAKRMYVPLRYNKIKMKKVREKRRKE